MEQLNQTVPHGSLPQSNNLKSMILMSLICWTFFKCIALVWQRLEIRRIAKQSGIPQAEGGDLVTGNARQFTLNNFCHFLLDSHKRLGKYIAVFYGPDPAVFTTDLDLIDEVFVTDGRRHMNQFDLRMKIVPHLTGGLFQLKGEKWRQARKSLDPLYSKLQITSRSELEERNESCRKLEAHIATKPADLNGGRKVDVLHDFTAFAMDISFKKVLDRHDLIELKQGKKNVLVEGTEKGRENFYSPLMKLYFVLNLEPLKHLQPFTMFGKYCQRLSEIITESIEIKRHNLGESGREKLITTRGPSLPAKVIDAVIAHDPKLRAMDPVYHLSFVLLSSYETTSKTLTILFWLLAKHPEIQKRLRQAIISDGEEPVYLDWCIKETVRLYPPVPMTARVLAHDVTTSTGKTISKGTGLAICPYTIHRIQDYWGADAEEFRPDRFAQPLAHRCQFVGFGAGIRGCPGQLLAMKVLREITTLLLIKYRIEPTDATPISLNWSPRNYSSIILRGPIELNFIEIDQDASHSKL